LIALLHDLAARVGTASEEHEYGENKAVWLEDGNKVLDYMEAENASMPPVSKTAWESKGSSSIRMT